MALVIDTVDGQGLNYEALHELLPKNSKVMLYLPFITWQKLFNQLYIIITRQSASVLKVGVPCGLREDWPIVLQEFRHKTTLYYFQKVLSLKYWSTKRV